jgi:hypothetical protein
LAEGNGLCLLLGRESAALSGHGVHSRLGRRLSDLSIEPGQPQELVCEGALPAAVRTWALAEVLLTTVEDFVAAALPVTFGFVMRPHTSSRSSF